MINVRWFLGLFLSYAMALVGLFILALVILFVSRVLIALVRKFWAKFFPIEVTDAQICSETNLVSGVEVIHEQQLAASEIEHLFHRHGRYALQKDRPRS